MITEPSSIAIGVNPSSISEPPGLHRHNDAGCCGNGGARRFLITLRSPVAIVVVCEIVAAILVLYVFVEQNGKVLRAFMVSTLRDY